MPLLVHDGRRSGHAKWVTTAVSLGVADGAFISPFATPRVPQRYHPDAGSLLEGLLPGHEVFFDPNTHARLLPGANLLAQYDTWGLWGPAGVGLGSVAQRSEHVERVFARQRELGLPLLAPTTTLQSPLSADAHNAVETARMARGLSAACYQALAGTRAFFSSGADLDAHVGRLAALRAPGWVVTLVNDAVLDGSPDCAPVEAFVGWMRTIHSLSQRSRVITAHADFLGLLAVAAGADTIGSGWDRGMRFFDPSAFVVSTPAIRRPASYVTQRGLVSVLRRTIADDIQRLDSALAERLRHGQMPADDARERWHHLRMLRELVGEVSAHPARGLRVHSLREIYEQALRDYNALRARVRILAKADQEAWVEKPLRALEMYASAEGF